VVRNNLINYYEKNTYSFDDCEKASSNSISSGFLSMILLISPIL
jgi:hypothetical protein